MNKQTIFSAGVFERNTSTMSCILIFKKKFDKKVRFREYSA